MRAPCADPLTRRRFARQAAREAHPAPSFVPPGRRPAHIYTAPSAQAAVADPLDEPALTAPTPSGFATSSRRTPTLARHCKGKRSLAAPRAACSRASPRLVGAAAVDPATRSCTCRYERPSRTALRISLLEPLADAPVLLVCWRVKRYGSGFWQVRGSDNAGYDYWRIDATSAPGI
jgi:hypothetical protein